MKKLVAFIMAAAMAVTVFSTVSFAAEAQIYSGNDTGAARKTADDSFTLGASEEPTSLEPSNAQVLTGWMITAAVYDTLVKTNEDGSMENVLAESVEYTDDTTLVIKVKQGIKFHNGTELTADDVLFTLERLAASSRYGTNYACIDFENTTIDDDYTLTVKLTEAYAPLLAFLGHQSAGIMSRAYFDEVGEEGIARSPMGTGAFIFDSWTSGDRVVCHRNDEYWGEEPAYKDLIVRFIPEATTRMVEFETGAVDAIIDPASEDIERMEAGEIDDAILYQFQGELVTRVEMYEGFEPFQNEDVRRAIIMAIDWPASVEIAYGSAMQYTSCELPSDCRFYVETPDYEYDPEAAKALLAEAGYPDGFELYTAVTAGSSDAQLLEIIQAQLAEIGVSLEIETTDVMTMIQKELTGEANFGVVNGTASVKDPDQVVSNVKASSPFALTSKTTLPELDELLVTAAASVDDDTRAELYAEAMNYIYDHAVNIPCAVSVVNFCVQDYIDYFPATASGHIEFSTITFK